MQNSVVDNEDDSTVWVASGGAIANGGIIKAIEECTFQANKADYYGSDIFSSGQATTIIRESVFKTPEKNGKPRVVGPILTCDSPTNLTTAVFRVPKDNLGSRPMLASHVLRESTASRSAKSNQMLANCALKGHSMRMKVCLESTRAKYAVLVNFQRWALALEDKSTFPILSAATATLDFSVGAKRTQSARRAKMDTFLQFLALHFAIVALLVQPRMKIKRLAIPVLATPFLSGVRWDAQSVVEIRIRSRGRTFVCPALLAM